MATRDCGFTVANPATFGASGNDSGSTVNGTVVNAVNFAPPLTNFQRSLQMRYEIPQNTAFTVDIFLTGSDGRTPLAGLTLTAFFLGKGGGADTSVPGMTYTDRGNGRYTLNLLTTDTDTLGSLFCRFTGNNGVGSVNVFVGQVIVALATATAVAATATATSVAAVQTSVNAVQTSVNAVQTSVTAGSSTPSQGFNP